MSNFHALEVVGRGSETQLLMSENLNFLSGELGYAQAVSIENMARP